MSTKQKTSSPQPNQRADVNNPNNPAYKANVDNRSRQLNPEHSTYHSSRKKP